MEVCTCPITLEELSDESLVHRSPGGIGYNSDSLKIWMNLQDRSSGTIYYPTRESISVEDALSVGIISFIEEDQEDIDNAYHLLSNNLTDLVISWLDCFQSFKEDAENGIILTDQTYQVDFHNDSINHIRNLMGYNNMRNFEKIVEVLRRDAILHDIHVENRAEYVLNSIDSSSYIDLDWTYRESIEWMIENEFPIRDLSNPEMGIFYGGFPTNRIGTLQSIDVPGVTKKATLELIDKFILQIGVEKSCMYIDESDYSSLSRQTLVHISNHTRSSRLRRRTFRREILGDIISH